MDTEENTVAKVGEDDPKIEVNEISDPVELDTIAPYHQHYKSLGFGDATMVMLAPTLVVPLARAVPVKRESWTRAILVATAALALVAGSGCVALGLT